LGIYAVKYYTDYDNTQLVHTELSVYIIQYTHDVCYLLCSYL